MDDGVAAEFTLRGTHEGELRGMPPTGKAFECRMVALFLFEADSDRIVCERVYFDTATILAQLFRRLNQLRAQAGAPVAATRPSASRTSRPRNGPAAHRPSRTFRARA